MSLWLLTAAQTMAKNIDWALTSRVSVITGDSDDRESIFVTDDDIQSLRFFLMRGQQTVVTNVIIGNGTL